MGQKLKIELTLDASQFLNKRPQDLIADAAFTRDGKIVVPIDLGNGYTMGNPAPCGTWELTDAE